MQPISPMKGLHSPILAALTRCRSTEDCLSDRKTFHHTHGKIRPVINIKPTALVVAHFFDCNASACLPEGSRLQIEFGQVSRTRALERLGTVLAFVRGRQDEARQPRASNEQTNQCTFASFDAPQCDKSASGEQPKQVQCFCSGF